MAENGQIRKLIDVPLGSLKVLSALATAERMAVKNYMEIVLIKHANRHYLKSKKTKK